MFASQITDKVTIKGDGGDKDVVVTIRKLSWGQLREAREAISDAALQTASKAGPDLLRVFREGATDVAVVTPAAARAAVYRAYDMKTVLKFGVESWTDPRNPAQALDDLDEETATLLHKAIVDLSIPKDDAAALGEGSGTSTGS